MFSNNLPEFIYKEVAQSKMENLIDYIYLHFIEKGYSHYLRISYKIKILLQNLNFRMSLW